jgi:uroporphyrinogen decarboxylase
VRPEQWKLFKAAARHEPVARVPLALIVDSPWMPGYVGMDHLTFYLDPEAWFQANLKVAREFPDVILFPSWWVEYGMAIEPSAFGTRLHFFDNQAPGQSAVLFRLEDIDRFSPINPLTDGFMPLALARYRMQKQRIFDEGFTIPVVTARGPLCTASFVRGVNDLMTDFVENPEGAHRLLKFCTEATIRWLEAQAEAIGPSVDGLFILDDIPGMLSRRMFVEFAQPYFRQIFDAFPKDWVKVYHNDAKVKPFVADLPELGFDVLNFTHNLDIAALRDATCGKICLMGNVAPLDLGVRGTPEQVKAAALEVLGRMNGQGMILSMGGGVSPGMPRENIQAMAEAAREFTPSI